jgi:hypothetical protein
MEELKYKASHYTERCTSSQDAFKKSLHVVLTNERFEAIREQLKTQDAPWRDVLYRGNDKINKWTDSQETRKQTFIRMRFIVAYYAAAYEYIRDERTAKIWKNVLRGKDLLSETHEIKPDEPKPIRARL